MSKTTCITTLPLYSLHSPALVHFFFLSVAREDHYLDFVVIILLLYRFTSYASTQNIVYFY